MTSIKLKCGCEIPVVDGKIHINYDNLNYDCSKVWKLYSEGYTRSIFQLESRLCQTWAKELKPKSITEAADLISVVRPGTLNSQDENGTSMTKVFANRKNELVEYDKDSPVAKMLRNTYSILCYQEQILKIAKDIAGFSPKDSNKLLKAIGKKQSAILIELEPLFIKGCEEKGIISKQEAIDLFNNIKNAGRYSFNFCVCPFSTFVETPNGIKSLNDLNINELVNSPDGFIEVLDKFDTGEKDIYEVELESGEIIRCTMEHEFLCDDNEKRSLQHILDNNLKLITKVNNS